MTETMQSFGLTWYRDSEGKVPSEYIKNYLLALELGYDPGSTTPSTGSGTDTDSLLANDSNYELNQYFYHKDQLGSNTHITDVYGAVYQHIEYTAWGELFIEERNIGQDLNPYLFTGKELDAMTNLAYYSQRYYSPRESIWLSVDPMMDKHGNFSPFAYCYNNPINLIDPFGLDTIPAGQVSFGNFNLAKDVIDFGSNSTNSYVESSAEAYSQETNIINKGNHQSSGNNGRVTEARGYSMDAVVAIGPAGFAIEMGSFFHKGKTYEFFSIGYAIGVEISAGINYFAIRDKKDSFVPSDFSGTGATDNGSALIYTYGRESATVNSSDPHRTGYKANSHGVGISLAPIGYSHINGKTMVAQFKEKTFYSSWQVAHGR